VEDVSRDGYDAAIDGGDLVVAHIVRGAIHALAPEDHALYGRALIARDDGELGVQLGRQVRGLTSAPGEALEEVAAATQDALAGGGALSKNELHEALRARVRADLMPWCRGCESHHVAPMLWRYATVKAGVRLDSRRRYTAGEAGRPPRASDAVRRFLGFYAPSTPGDFADWAGVAKPHAQRLWDEVGLAEVDGAWLLPEDVSAFESPPAAEGIRLLPPGDPYLQKPNRPLLAPDADLRKRLFRPVGSPGAVLHGGRLSGLWRPKAKGAKLELTVEPLSRLPRAELEEEAERLARLRGAAQVAVVVT
jgi:hypothetical protein